MKSTTDIACSKCLGTHPAESWETDAPGLVVVDTSTSEHARAWCEFPFSVTHTRSGLMVHAFESLDAALAFAQELALIGFDWTLSGDEVARRSTPAQRSMYRRLLADRPSTNASTDQREHAAARRAL